MKKLSFILTFLLMSVFYIQAQQAKYVFYFIGDGMGVNQVLGTEMYQSELKGEIGVTQLLFTQFPYATVAHTFSASHGVTDSAAAGTAVVSTSRSASTAARIRFFIRYNLRVFDDLIIIAKRQNVNNAAAP